MSRVVIGIDLSLTKTGVASTEGWCRLIGKRGITTMPLAQRITAVEGLVLEIVDAVDHADMVVIEGLLLTTNRTGCVEMAALWWQVATQLHTDGMPVAVVPPGVLKKYATGKGNAPKGAIIEAVTKRLGDQFSTGGDDNLCDAVVLAAMGADWLGEPLAPMPATHRRALNNVAWPNRGEMAG